VLVLDSKRGDIGDTAKQYAIEAFERYHADAVTVNPYMGFDTIQPYLAHAGKGVIVLCRTSNAGGSDFQSLNVGGNNQELLYERIARLAATQWNSSGQLSLVVGATFPAELAKVRSIVGDMPLLVPGVGAQGGDVPATVTAGSDAAGYGMMINSSRAILYAGAYTNNTVDFKLAAATEAKNTRDTIRTACSVRAVR
jgi:orotidine-5'-phosphate decarboxylase